MFIEPDERIIIMDELWSLDCPEGYPLNTDEFKRLRDIGIKTIVGCNTILWDEVEPHAGAALNFSRLDAFMERIEQSDQKALIPFFLAVPTWKSDSWYLRRDQFGVPDYRNPETLDDCVALARTIIARYDPKHFQLIFGVPATGEFPVHFHAYSSQLVIPNTQEIIPTEDLIDWVRNMQAVLEAQHGEVWSSYHVYTKPRWYHQLNDAMRRAFPDSAFYSFQWTYFNPLRHRKHIKGWLQEARDRWGMKFFVGSEYCQGLREHTPIVKEHGLYGFVTGPLHEYQEYRRMEPWMYAELSWALEELRM